MQIIWKKELLSVEYILMALYIQICTYCVDSISDCLFQILKMNSCYLIWLTLIIFETTALEENLYNSTIYGVRWFLGQNFQFQPPLPEEQSIQPPCDLMAMFNSYQHFPNLNFAVSIDQMLFQCSLNILNVEITEMHHSNFNDLASQKGNRFETYIYRCPIKFETSEYLESYDTISYSVISQDEDNNESVIFSANLKSPKPQSKDSKVLIFGDWGVITNFSKEYQLIQPIKECLLEYINEESQIRLLLLLGDLAYDLQGYSYIQFFQNIQQISQRIVILLTPGNHETIKHKDLFKLVQQSFYSPYWNRFMGYFDLVAFGQYLFFGYNPENIFGWLGPSSLFKESILQQKYKHLNYLLQIQLQPQSRQRIRQYKLIAYTHYPIYCSEEDQHESAQKYRRLQDYYYRMLVDLGLDIYFSGHLHIYQRSKPICTDGSYLNPLIQKDNKVTYKMGCPLFIVEGAAGNNYYVEVQRHFKLKSHSAKFVENTGFGLLTLHHEDSSDEKFLFEHISMTASCSAVDTVSIIEPKTVQKTIEYKQIQVSNQTGNSKVIIVMIILIVIVFYVGKRWLEQKRQLARKLIQKKNEYVLQMSGRQHFGSASAIRIR